MYAHSLTRPRLSGDGAACSLGAVRFHVAPSGRSGARWPHGELYRWTIRIGRKEWTDTDLGAPAMRVDGESDDDVTRGMCRSLLSFLSACLESREYTARTGREGDNGDLFPADLCERLTGLGIDSDDLYLPERGE